MMLTDAARLLRANLTPVQRTTAPGGAGSLWVYDRGVARADRVLRHLFPKFAVP